MSTTLRFRPRQGEKNVEDSLVQQVQTTLDTLLCHAKGVCSRYSSHLVIVAVAAFVFLIQPIQFQINYDLPLNTNMFEQRWGRFLRLGRKGEFRMIVLRDQAKALSWEEELLKTLEDYLSSEKHLHEK